MTAAFEPIVGRYMQLELFGRKHRIYLSKPARARRCCACTLPAPTGGNIAR